MIVYHYFPLKAIFEMVAAHKISCFSLNNLIVLIVNLLVSFMKFMIILLFCQAQIIMELPVGTP